MYLLFDIGGTKTRVAVVEKEAREIDKMKIFPTPDRFEDAIDQIVSTAKELAGNIAEIEKAAGGLATPLNKEKSAGSFHSEKQTFKDWVDKPLKEALEKELDVKVLLENDAAMGALGEATFGVAKGYEIVVFYTISTGVGGAKIEGGKIDKSSSGFEPGWQIIDPTGAIWPESREVPVHLGIIDGRNIERIKGKVASKVKDEEFWKKVAKTLGIALYNSMVIWSPDIFVIGGSVAKQIPLEIVTQELEKIPSPFKKTPAVKRAALGEKCGLYGALHYLKNLN